MIIQGGASGSLDHHKSVYRVLWNEMQQEKSELASSNEAFAQLKLQMMEKFGSWYQKRYNVQLPITADQKALNEASGGG